MWLMLKNSFVSVVQHREQPDCVLVRARRKGDLEKLFPARCADVFQDQHADYRYRLIAPKQELVEAVAGYIFDSLDYDNFKAAQAGDSLDWHRFLHRVWSAGHALQNEDGSTL